jgi:hypothetical protein
MVEFYFSREIFPKYEENIAFYSQDIEYQGILVQTIPQVILEID